MSKMRKGMNKNHIQDMHKAQNKNREMSAAFTRRCWESYHKQGIEPMENHRRNICYFCLKAIKYNDQVDKHHKFPKMIMKQYGILPLKNAQSTVIVHRSCHVKFHADVSRSLEIARKWARREEKEKIESFRDGGRYLAYKKAREAIYGIMEEIMPLLDRLDSGPTMYTMRFISGLR